MQGPSVSLVLVLLTCLGGAVAAATNTTCSIVGGTSSNCACTGGQQSNCVCRPGYLCDCIGVYGDCYCLSSTSCTCGTTNSRCVCGTGTCAYEQTGSTTSSSSSRGGSGSSADCSTLPQTALKTYGIMVVVWLVIGFFAITNAYRLYKLDLVKIPAVTALHDPSKGAGVVPFKRGGDGWRFRLVVLFFLFVSIWGFIFAKPCSGYPYLAIPLGIALCIWCWVPFSELIFDPVDGQIKKRKTFLFGLGQYHLHRISLNDVVRINVQSTYDLWLELRNGQSMQIWAGDRPSKNSRGDVNIGPQATAFFDAYHGSNRPLTNFTANGQTLPTQAAPGGVYMGTPLSAPPAGVVATQPGVYMGTPLTPPPQQRDPPNPYAAAPPNSYANPYAPTDGSAPPAYPGYAPAAAAPAPAPAPAPVAYVPYAPPPAASDPPPAAYAPPPVAYAPPPVAYAPPPAVNNEPPPPAYQPPPAAAAPPTGGLRFCPHCGQQQQPSATPVRFCPFCGVDISGVKV